MLIELTVVIAYKEDGAVLTEKRVINMSDALELNEFEVIKGKTLTNIRCRSKIYEVVESHHEILSMLYGIDHRRRLSNKSKDDNQS